MKKIIIPGKKELITKPIYEATCDRCGCKFEFEDEDVTQRTRNFGIANTIWIDCPFCGKELKIYSPNVVREEVIEKDGDKANDSVNILTDATKGSIEKMNDIYALGKIMLIYADTPVYSISPDDSEITLNVTIKDYNKLHLNYINLLIKIFSNDALYRKELLAYIENNEQMKKVDM